MFLCQSITAVTLSEHFLCIYQRLDTEESGVGVVDVRGAECGYEGLRV